MKLLYKVILIICTIVFSIVLPLSTLAIIRSQEIIIRDMFEICDNLSEDIGSIAREELFLNRTYDASTAVISKLRKSGFRGLLNIYLLNVEGKYIVTMNPESSIKPISQDELQYIKSINSLSHIEIEEGRKTILRFIYPVFLENNTSFKVGAAIFDFDKEIVFLPVKQIRTDIFQLGILFFIFFIFIAILIGVLLTRPIKILTTGVNIIQSGNLSHTIHLPNEDEIGNLAKSFNKMTFTIKQANEAKDKLMNDINELNLDLEQKVILRTEQLNEMVDQLGTLYSDSENKRKEIESLAESRKKLSLVGQMAAGIVHDIKNPMATIKYLAEMLNSEEVTIETRTDNLNLIVREMDRLSDLAYEILDFSKGKLNLDLQELNLRDFIFEIEKFLAMDFEYLRVKCILDLRYEGNISIDKDRMRRVIVNLAKNAIEAMYDRKKEYSLTIRSEKILPDSITISLIDNGPGIPESVQERIFQAFATEGKAKGTGLGLFMCKWIVEAHNGELTYETKLGEGTTFFIHLPQS